MRLHDHSVIVRKDKVAANVGADCPYNDSSAVEDSDLIAEFEAPHAQDAGLEALTSCESPKRSIDDIYFLYIPITGARRIVKNED